MPTPSLRAACNYHDGAGQLRVISGSRRSFMDNQRGGRLSQATPGNLPASEDMIDVLWVSYWWIRLRAELCALFMAG